MIGRIVSITSILARLNFPNTSVYTATKHGLDGFFSSLRFDLLNHGIHVATVEPGDFSRTTDIMQVKLSMFCMQKRKKLYVLNSNSKSHRIKVFEPKILIHDIFFQSWYSENFLENHMHIIFLAKSGKSLYESMFFISFDLLWSIFFR